MDNSQKHLQHFFLTRFNILLWNKDKEGRPVRNVKWLEHRFMLFERFCFSSIKSQTCQDFEWIVLFDSTTPERFKTKIVNYQNDCPQMIPVFVSPEKGRFFSDIFRGEICKRLHANRILTTYLDNDDALNVRFVEDLHKRVCSVEDCTFFYYDEGYQYYTENNYLMRIHYPKNHFVSVVENGDATKVKGIFGYGRHYYIDQIEGVRIEHIKNKPMWCEVVHEKNMLNDANFLFRTSMVRDENVLKNDFSIEEAVQCGAGIYMFKFLPRYVKTFMKRAKLKVFGRKW